MFDLIIKNGSVYDGTGTKPQVLDIGIKAAEIEALGNLRGKSAKTIIDAGGDCVAPGFIDIQNHSDSFWTLFDYPHQESLLLQGITTIIVGHCGASLAPLPSLAALKSVQKWHTLEGSNFNWQYFDEYLDAVENLRLGVNVGSMTGHSTVRRGLLKDEVRSLTEQEMKVLERTVFSSLKSGSFGLSLGLVYSHEYDSSFEELLRLSRLVKMSNRLLSVHLRSEGASILESLDEVLKLASDSGVRVKISHLKIRGEKNWRLFPELIKRLEQAYQKGVVVSFDVYPYATSWSVLYTYLPKWSYEGGRVELIKRLQQPYLRNKILSGLIEQRLELSKITIATDTSSPHLIGRTLGQIAADQGNSVEEALLNLLVSCDSEVVVFDENISEENLKALISHPLAMIATDGAGFDLHETRKFKNLVHPRCFGAMPRFLSQAVKNDLMPMEQAIFKITGMPARVLGMPGRGVIKKRARADLAIFNKSKLADLASLNNPFQQPRGISWVIVGGELSVAEGKITGRFGGHVLKAR